MDLAHRQGNPLLGLLPREHAHFGLRRQHRGLHRHGIGMGRDIIGEDQDGRLAIAHEIARHGEDESGIFRTEYEGKTLRGNLGLPRPKDRFFEA
jgi:hypothetical protein